MRDSYELWDLETGNCLDVFDDEEAALAAVREIAEQDGPGSVLPLGLGRRDAPAEFTAIAEGQTLLARITASVS